MDFLATGEAAAALDRTRVRLCGSRLASMQLPQRPWGVDTELSQVRGGFLSVWRGFLALKGTFRSRRPSTLLSSGCWLVDERTGRTAIY